MTKPITLHEGVIRRSLVAELEAFRSPEQRVSSYYLDIDLRRWGSARAVALAVKDAMIQQRERIDKLDLPHEDRQALRRDWEQVNELAQGTVGNRTARSLACFVASGRDHVRALPLSWPTRNRAFFEDRFVLWPLYLVLEHVDRYGICLSDKERGRLFLYYMEHLEEAQDVFDEVPGRIHFPEAMGEPAHTHKHVEHFHHHFENVAQAALRLFEKEPFEHLIVGGRVETLPQFEEHLHRYLRDRVVARWEIDVRAPTEQIRERAQKEESDFLARQAQGIWQTIQDFRVKRGAVGPEEAFAALWQRRVQSLLVEPNQARKGIRCAACGRLNLGGEKCVECGGKAMEVSDVFEEAVRDAIEQSALMRYWQAPVLREVGSVAALKRY